MRKDLIKLQPLHSSFLSCEKDTQTILKSLFVESAPYSDMLKRLLIINKPDCLDKSNQEYQQMVDNKSLGQLIDEGLLIISRQVKIQSLGTAQLILMSFVIWTNGVQKIIRCGR